MMSMSKNMGGNQEGVRYRICIPILQLVPLPHSRAKPSAKSSSRGLAILYPTPLLASGWFGGWSGSGPPWWLNIVVAFQEGAFARCLSKGNGGKLFIQSAANVVQAARVNRRTRSLSSIFYLSEVAIFLRAI